ncbi:FG-GAP-like repeat-containing protein [Streptomyces sp. NBC_01549]|uniref:FG-GAP-like repeat-containing protein n=1 Tax=Streptomyces sp. NBC_01549 TaxID=2975874 RepID=UPI002259DCE6|nr:FG-GAP-like repeat-containing protein [Streptomyces sp. NBC_01549]MCX4590334.1 FG-GAP-like repeat-containing protein [Streptomyces sp. NBC_01549]
MARRSLIRGAVAAAVSMTLASGLAPLTAGTAYGEAVPGEVVVPATTAMVPRTSLLSAGPSGFLRYESDGGYLWTSYAGADTVVDASGTDPFGTPDFGAGSDVVARYDDTSRTVTLRDMSTGESRTVTLPSGHRYWNTLGSTVVTIAGSLGTDAALHLLDPQDDGSLTDRAVEGLPDVIDDMYEVNAALGDAHGQVVQYRRGMVSHAGWLDADQGRWIPLPYNVDLTPGHIAVTPTHLMWWQDGTVSISSRQDLTAAPRTVPLAGDGQLHGMIGDTLIVSRYDSSLGRYDYFLPVWRVEAVALDGSTTKTLLARSRGLALPTPDGRLLVPGGSDTDHWGVSVIEAADGGGVTLHGIADAHPQQTVHQVSQLTLTQGRLNTLERDPAQERTFLYTRDAGVAGSLTVGTRTVRGPVPADYDNCWNGECPSLQDTGDGRTVVTGLNRGGPTADLQPQLLGPTQSLPGTRIDSSRTYMRTAAATGRFAALMGPYKGTGHEIRVIDVDSGRTVFTTMESVVAMWGTTLWVRDSNNSVVPVDVLTGQRGTQVWFGNGCLLEDLQAVGRWLLWTCVGSAEGQGVYDTVKGTNLRLIDGPDWGRAGLGDGFVVTEEDGHLKVTDVRSGTPVSHTAGEFERWRPWDVDPYTGVIAHVGGDSGIHLVPSGVPVSVLSQLDATVVTSVDVKGGTGQWSPKWWLNKPAASWKLVITNKATGRAVRTLSGGLARGLVSTAWNGKDGSGRLVPNGAYTWTLTATPADGQGAGLTKSGTVKLSGGAAVPRDFIGSDGFGELLTLNGSGALTYHRGDGAGKFSTKTTGSGWPTTVKAVPYGDLNGDRCNDVLVRFSSGALRAYKPGCGKALTPSTPYTSLGTSGWNQYDILTSPGDITGDGRADLIARQSSTGDVYLFKATSTGKLSARTKLYSRWTGYKKIVGAGDLNGDGRGDLLAQDKSNELWRYEGTSSGTFKARVKVFNDWGASYNAVVGVGDITGDGRADLVSRDTSGNLWRSTGNGKGSFGARSKIATGWQGYKALS